MMSMCQKVVTTTVLPYVWGSCIRTVGNLELPYLDVIAPISTAPIVSLSSSGVNFVNGGACWGTVGRKIILSGQPDSHSVENADKSGFMLDPNQLGRLLVEPVLDSVKGRASHDAACHCVDHLVSGVTKPALLVIREASHRTIDQCDSDLSLILA